MATNYGMGQLRFNRGFEYKHDLELPYKSVPVQNSTSESEFFRDMVIISEEAFDVNSSYLLHLKVPKNPNYQTVFRVKLLGSLASGGNTMPEYVNPNTSDYQIVKYIEIPKMTGSGTNSRVILYPVNAGTDDLWDGTSEYDCRVAIVEEDLNKARVGDIVFIGDKYYKWSGDIDTSIEIINKNDVIVSHTWALNDVELDSVDFDIIFSPRSADEEYRVIWVEMFRESYDLDIYYEQEEDSQAKGYYGRKIDEDYFDAKVYSLANLVASTGESSLNHIGVYGHPNLIMALNGEEIRIGQSGYYELNDFEITNLGIAADNMTDTDRFTVDYQYAIN